MARKKAPPKRAPEYEKPKPKKKSPPGKAKDGSKCFTRTNKGGAAYVTCEGSQKKAKARAALVRGGSAPVMTKKKAPAKPKPKAKAPAAKPKPQVRSKMYAVSTTKSPDNPTFNVKNTKAAQVKGKAPPKPKPAQNIDTFLEVMSVMATRNKDRIADSLRPKLEEFSISQLKTAIKKDYEEKNPGRTMTKRGNDKKLIIDFFIKNKVNPKFLPKKGRKEPTQEYTLEGFGIADDETGEIPSYLSDRLPDAQFYPSGLTALTGKLTKKQASDLAKEIKDYGGEASLRFYRETPKSRIHFWADPL
jgi:hypothetical protein